MALRKLWREFISELCAIWSKVHFITACKTYERILKKWQLEKGMEKINRKRIEHSRNKSLPFIYDELSSWITSKYLLTSIPARKNGTDERADE